MLLSIGMYMLLSIHKGTCVNEHRNEYVTEHRSTCVTEHISNYGDKQAAVFFPSPHPYREYSTCSLQVPVKVCNSELFVRLSAHVHNELSEFQHLADVMNQLMKE